MAENRSDESRYPSRYSPGGWVTAAQYIIELVCEQKARHENKDLPIKFWTLKEWERFFVSQTRVCHKLLKSYSSQAIINAIKAKRIRTLLPKWIVSVIQLEQKKLDAMKKEVKPKEPERDIINVPRRREGKAPSALNKLLALDEELEDGEEER